MNSNIRHFNINFKGEIMKRMVVIVFMVLLAISIYSCKKGEVDQKYAAHYTEAVSSLLWCRGTSSSGTIKINPQIEVIDRDSFGRILFSYKEGFSADLKDLSSINIYAFLVMQAEDTDFVYFYEGNNYICVDFNNYQEESIQKQIDELKKSNDWEKEFNLNKCIKKCKSAKKILNSFDNNVKSYIKLKKKEVGADLRVCTSAQDNFGRTIISMSEFGMTPWVGKLIVCIIQPDGSVICSDDYNIVFDYYEYHNSLEALKNVANWNNEFITK